MKAVRIIPFAGGSRVLPSLALGSITAYARQQGIGVSASPFEILPQMTSVDELTTLLEADSSPVVLLGSNYLWTFGTNLEASALTKALAPGSITIHGGPHTPHYEADNRRFFEENPHVDLTIRQEGEIAVARVLGSINPSRLGDLSGLEVVPGSTVRMGVNPRRNESVERIDDLAVLPSAYLSGELSHLEPEKWTFGIIETNRGCPYGCTFCDWGQMTLARVRKFPLERVLAEIDWLAEHRVEAVFIADANFGIFPRDVEIALHIARRRAETGFPRQALATFAKNTNRYVRQIVQAWVDGGIWTEATMSMQTTDPTTLATVRRENIRSGLLEELSEEFRSLGLRVAGDLILGLPGSTVESFKRDLQFFFDRRVMARVFEAILLPNSPMNEPEYRRLHQIEASEDHRVRSTATYTRGDREQMMRLRRWNRLAVDHGLLRETLRFVQREHGIPAVEVLHELDRLMSAESGRYPMLNFLARYFDIMMVPPGPWPDFYQEVRRFLRDRMGLDHLPGWETVAAVESALRPRPGRVFPDTVDLTHDYVTYAADLDNPKPLADYGPGKLTVDDPLDVTRRFVVVPSLNLRGNRRRDAWANEFWWNASWELESELTWPIARPSPNP